MGSENNRVLHRMWWVGCLETIQPPILPWFFHRDYASDVAGSVRYVFKKLPYRLQAPYPSQVYTNLDLTRSQNWPATSTLPQSDNLSPSAYNATTSADRSIQSTPEAEEDLADCLSQASTPVIEGCLEDEEAKQTKVGKSPSDTTPIGTQLGENPGSADAFSSAVEHGVGGVFGRQSRGEFHRTLTASILVLSYLSCRPGSLRVSISIK